MKQVFAEADDVRGGGDTRSDVVQAVRIDGKSNCAKEKWGKGLEVKGHDASGNNVLRLERVDEIEREIFIHDSDNVELPYNGEGREEFNKRVAITGSGHRPPVHGKTVQVKLVGRLFRPWERIESRLPQLERVQLWRTGNERA